MDASMTAINMLVSGAPRQAAGPDRPMARLGTLGLGGVRTLDCLGGCQSFLRAQRASLQAHDSEHIARKTATCRRSACDPTG